MGKDIKTMLIERILAAKSDFCTAAYINLLTGERHQNAELEFMLLTNPNNISEVDSEDAELNSEGNLDGLIGIYLNNDDWIIFEGENFSPLFARFDHLEDEEKIDILTELFDQIK